MGSSFGTYLGGSFSLVTYLDIEKVVHILVCCSKNFEINGKRPVWQIMVSFCLCIVLVIFLCWMNHIWDQGSNINLDKILMYLSGSNIPSVPCPYSPLWATPPPAGQPWKVQVQENRRNPEPYSVQPRYQHYASNVHGSRVRTWMFHHIYLIILKIYYKIHYTFLLFGRFNSWHSQNWNRLFWFSEADAVFQWASLNSSNLPLTYLTQPTQMNVANHWEVIWLGILRTCSPSYHL